MLNKRIFGENTEFITIALSLDGYSIAMYYEYKGHDMSRAGDISWQTEALLGTNPYIVFSSMRVQL